MAKLLRSGRIFYGWWVVLAGALINSLGALHFYGFTVFFLPLSLDLNLSRAATSLVFSLSRAEGAVEGPLAGYIIDRFGPRLVMLGGITVVGLGYICLSRVDSYLWFLVVYVGLISLGFNAGFLHAVLAAVNNWFIRRRALVMAIVLSAFGLGGAVITPLLSLAVSELGWRMATILAGVAMWVICLPCALAVKRSPESVGLLPDGDAAPGSSIACCVSIGDCSSADATGAGLADRRLGDNAFDCFESDFCCAAIVNSSIFHHGCF